MTKHITQLYKYEITIVLEQGSLKQSDSFMEKGPYEVLIANDNTLVIQVDNEDNPYFVRVAKDRKEYSVFNRHDALLDDWEPHFTMKDTLYGTHFMFSTYTKYKVDVDSILKIILEKVKKNFINPALLNLNFIEEAMA